MNRLGVGDGEAFEQLRRLKTCALRPRPVSGTAAAAGCREDAQSRRYHKRERTAIQRVKKDASVPRRRPRFNVSAGAECPCRKSGPDRARGFRYPAPPSGPSTSRS